MLKGDLVQTFADAIVKNWEKPCFSDYQHEPLMYREVAFKIKEMHAVFEKLEIKKGDKIALSGKNCSNWAIVYLSTVMYGAVVVPILSDFSPEDMHHLIDHSESKIFFVSDQIFSKLSVESMPGLAMAVSLEKMEVIFSRSDEAKDKYSETVKDFEQNKTVTQDDFTFDIPDKYALASIVYTSGTTGFSKGVMIPHNAILANIEFAVEALPVKPGSMLSFLPLAHSFGCVFDFLLQVVRGLHIVFFNKAPTPNQLVKAFRDVQPFLVLTVPLILEKIYRAKIMPLFEKRWMKLVLKVPLFKKIIFKKIGRQIQGFFGGECYEVIAGGAAFNPKIESFLLNSGVQFTVGYGMTECTPLIAYTDYHKGRKKGSCGRIIEPYLTAKIDNPDKKGVGEICVKGENLMLGYYKMEKETADAIDSEGWLHTGDLGFIDKDGFVFIRGRSKDMILSSSGQNIYPEEIENQLNYLPYVMESLVLDAGSGKLVALIYPDKEKIRQDNLDDAALAEIMEANRNELNEKIPSYAKISEFIMHPEEFEKTATKKIKRRLYVSSIKKILKKK